MTVRAATAAPFYLPLGDEIELFLGAYAARLPVLLKGPTGCGKTRFIEAMAHRVAAQRATARLEDGTVEDDTTEGPTAEDPTAEDLVTVACHEDLSATDLVGRYLLHGDETVWIDGPLTRAVRHGSICYLDEIVEARKDTTVLIHALTDHRRFLPIEKLGTTLHAHADFLLVLSYNPGYQSVLKELKPSTRQRFVALEFHYPSVEQEAEILHRESGLPGDQALRLAALGAKIRNLQEQGFEHGVSTRLLVYSAQLMQQGIAPERACDTAIAQAISDSRDVQSAISDLVRTFF